MFNLYNLYPIKYSNMLDKHKNMSIILIVSIVIVKLSFIIRNN